MLCVCVFIKEREGGDVYETERERESVGVCVGGVLFTLNHSCESPSPCRII